MGILRKLQQEIKSGTNFHLFTLFIFKQPLQIYPESFRSRANIILEGRKKYFIGDSGASLI